MARILLKDYLKTNHKSYISHKIERADFIKYIENIKVAYTQILEAVKTNATEENIKNIVINFIKDTFYADRKDIQINSFERIDYAIKKNDNIEVIMEFKKPSNKAEMITCDNMNKKALHEAIKYFYDEKHKGNYHIKNIIIGDGISYFIFNPLQFQHKSLEKLCYDSIEGDLYLQRTSEIYKEIANIITREKITFEFAWFDLTYLEKRIKDFDLNNVDINDKAIRTLLYVYKLFHPDFLLNEYSPKDSNQLNKKFYDELLYILGLEEVGENNKKLIKPNPNSNGLINETIKQLEDQKDITGEKAVSIAFELVITWLNRILFLKLFESQLVSFNDNKNFKFITSDKIIDFDELNKLFFSVLGKKLEDRDNAEETTNIPYLNSSLFEKSDMELKYINTTALNNNRKLALYKSSNLKHWSEYKNKTEEKILKYLLDFLDSYDFSSGASESLITEENRDIINSAVLGLIFEKLNGYKDGSFYTPGFITEYMAKECIERAVVDKFNAAFGDLNAKNIQEIRNYIGNVYSFDDAKKYNDIINSLRICDPAVGSGHFLVSVLNHIIYLKSYLGILFDDEGNKISNNIEVFDDTLVVFNQNDVPYAYKRKDRTTHQVQKALFKEKRTIIENCLFAVDINPKSVYICQLRLWIELLKNTYYIDNTDNMEVLPNIDINIKTGNSLVSKYPVQVGKAIVQQGSKEQKENIKQYKQLVAEYKNSGDKETKKKINETLKEIKSKLYSVVEGVLVAETEEQKKFDKQIKKLKSQGKKATTIEERLKIDKEIEKLSKSNHGSNKILVIGDSFDDPIYKNSMEWMLEFPEVLDENGKFQGFDIVIGNPPYGVSIKDNYRKTVEFEYGKVPDYEIYYYFIEIAHNLLKNKAMLSYIIPNTWLFNTFAEKYRINLLKLWDIKEILDCSKFGIFESATVRNSINLFQKEAGYGFVGYRNTENVSCFQDLVKKPLLKMENSLMTEMNQNWGLAFQLNSGIINIIMKINKIGSKLNDFWDLSQGYIPYRKSDLAKIYGEEKAKDIVENRLWHSNKKEDNTYIQEIFGRDLNKYTYKKQNSFVKYGKHLATYVDLKYFNQPRILVREITNPTVIACLVSELMVNDPQIITIINKEDGNNDLRMLWAILNSKLATFYHFNHSPKATKGAFPKILVKDLKEFPIAWGTDEINKKLISLSEEIHNMKQNDINADTSEKEAEIDKLVYQLYGLTDEEIKIVEESL